MTGPIILGITMGDPAGIGPEVIVRWFLRREPSPEYLPVVYGAPQVIERASALYDSALKIAVIDDPEAVRPGSELPVLPVGRAGAEALVLGRPSAASGKLALEAVERAAADALAGKIHAIVTAPLNKHALALAGAHVPGHTELFAQLCQVARPVMMLAAQDLRVAPVTIHCALSEVAAKLSEDLIIHTLHVVHQALVEDFGIPDPHLAVLGLNPHASDAGRFGDEEARIIEPAIDAVSGAKFRVSGPWPADGLFGRFKQVRPDAVIGMYHDQVLAPLKLYGMGRAVNLTLGLPIIRTSVDHGTAYDIAGQGKAEEGSFAAAVALALLLARRRRAR